MTAAATGAREHVVSVDLVGEDVRQPEQYRSRFNVTCSCREAPLALDVSESQADRTKDRHEKQAARRHR